MITVRKALLLFPLLIFLFGISCANRGTPSGGEKDTTPPVIVKSEPENFTTGFSVDEIEIQFDEYVKIKNLSKNLIISPPMDPEPQITPLGSASKKITIKLFDTLRPNTTYTFNFGESSMKYLAASLDGCAGCNDVVNQQYVFIRNEFLVF